MNMSVCDDDARLLGEGNVVTVRAGRYAVIDFRAAFDSSSFISNARKSIIIRFIKEHRDENVNQIEESGDDYNGLKNAYSKDCKERL